MYDSSAGIRRSQHTHTHTRTDIHRALGRSKNTKVSRCSCSCSCGRYLEATSQMCPFISRLKRQSPSFSVDGKAGSNKTRKAKVAEEIISIRLEKGASQNNALSILDRFESVDEWSYSACRVKIGTR